ncbi:ribosome recycling factor [Candidatus Uabimicrobium amorphum]|uniref:Ribosome-recycling factor n=1 Tax=Uabimicrobium amorphum TaxID=2596890 RepID=A0A5S9F5G6_UABAM|nr:ribosome recycling factor [Candidatus Uabimicrobium amorphum]BBM85534.1 ribosome-recycling factor [Candidatus Uabimicrobium amorphum]
MSYEEILLETEEKMEKAATVFSDELKGIRTGRATPGLIENIRADYYGSPTPLKQMASISVPEPRMLVVKPFDVSVIKSIEKAILKSDLGMTPNSDGKILRLQVPALSEERRKQIVNQVKDLAEKAKISIRNIRRDSNRQADQLEKKSEISEDDCKSLKDEIQELTKKFEDKVNEYFDKKQKEILEK